MKVIRNTTEFTLKNSCVTLGKFDGIHLGHRRLIESVVNCKELHPVVFTFEPLPGGPMSMHPMIYSEQEQEQIFALLGVEVLIRYPFSAKEAAMEAEEFIRTVLIDRVDAKGIVVGEDFHFGHGCTGDVHLLERLSKKYGYSLTVHKKLCYGEEEISSSRIRNCIKNGERLDAEIMLGIIKAPK